MTKMCLVVMDLGGIAKRGLPWSRGEVRPAPATVDPEGSQGAPKLRFRGP
ncbi:hypothetical protein GCM10010215_19030 [Streptomyces virginiae]|uniref:Uncharacterized protein n=1 Tax=Streptomyces virginiae TaxID=1961 RepID=A0ABQ3NJ20_STRVG|nr:hypothetical protein GCM10010215_19030 [Streptomyces virginiae]GHI12773.1 hypothetical protein Scinn_22360 [Streptomyces virginiae]